MTSTSYREVSTARLGLVGDTTWNTAGLRATAGMLAAYVN